MNNWDDKKKKAIQGHIPCDVEMLFNEMSPIGGPLQRSILLAIDGHRYLYRTLKYELFWLTRESEKATLIDFLNHPESKVIFQRYAYDFPQDKRVVLEACLVPGVLVETAFESYFQHSRPPRFTVKRTEMQIEVRVYSLVHMVPVNDTNFLERRALVEVSVDGDGCISHVDFVSFALHDALS